MNTLKKWWTGSIDASSTIGVVYFARTASRQIVTLDFVYGVGVVCHKTSDSFTLRGSLWNTYFMRPWHVVETADIRRNIYTEEVTADPKNGVYELRYLGNKLVQVKWLHYSK